MLRETGITASAVPKIIRAIGIVAQAAEGASSAPTKLPTRTIKGIIEPARAQLRLRTQTFLKSVLKAIFIRASQFRLSWAKNAIA
jgi:hypothetical protein